MKCWICFKEIYWEGDRWIHSVTREHSCCSCIHGLCAYSNTVATPTPVKVIK